ncbi:hypothetical protein QK289_12155 [Exiguobacterium antarcticum]|uniref:Uncharacterized protein n=1 Tax=Exiguobacterium antarcticum TaxID=132920 RepID=A0ABT6R479_9BACL|nr:hypothetical protein [Exiguobacterium antarcticum]MDI3235763.1 hypothetical protein [Exiguobacterium antarcticum]
MRKRLWLVLIVVVGLILYFEPFRGSPPEPDISVNGADIRVTSGSYCWNGLLISQCADTVYSTPLEMTEKQTPTVVKPGTIIEVAFNDGPPPQRTKAEQWLKDGTNKTVQLKNEQFTAPNKKGLYIYHVYGWWRQGDGNVAFAVQVK